MGTLFLLRCLLCRKDLVQKLEGSTNLQTIIFWGGKFRIRNYLLLLLLLIDDSPPASPTLFPGITNSLLLLLLLISHGPLTSSTLFPPAG